MVEYEAAVIGAGPGGLSTVAALLDTGITRIVWIDKEFGGGRLNTLYREISSNTKTGIYLDAINSSPTCSTIVKSTPKPNAVSRLESIDREETCQLSLAGDMVMMLIHGILESREGVRKCLDNVHSAELNDKTWSVKLASGRTTTTSQLHLSTGSHPRILDLHETYNPTIKVLDLDQTMILSSLPDQLPSDRKSIVGIIGNSHSGILACMNFHTVATAPSPSERQNTGPNDKDEQGEGVGTEYRDLEIINFQRREILFAEYREDGIVWDNSGLKGRTAIWARENMANSDEKNEIIKQVRLDKYEGGEEAAYREYLPKCTHLVYAVGYDQSPLPQIIIENQNKAGDLKFDMHTSGFTIPSPPTTSSGPAQEQATEKEKERGGSGSETGKKVYGLYGTGIAFPEETEDPEGHVEAAVGLAKFFKFAERVKGDWGKVC